MATPQILYTLIASSGNNTPLAEHAIVDGNISLIALKVVRKASSNSSASFYYDNYYVFHYLSEHQVTFLCLTDIDYPPQSALYYLTDLKERFFQKYGTGTEIQGYGVNTEFQEVIYNRSYYFNKDIRAERLLRLRKDLNPELEIVPQNIDQLLSPNEQTDIAVNRQSRQTIYSVDLRKRSQKRVSKTCWNNLRLSLVVIMVLLTILFFVIVMLCGGFSFENCG